MAAPERFVEWMSGYTANDKKFGRTVFRYHPRSDEHSRMLCRFVLDDLIEACPVLAAQAATGKVVGGINAPFTFSNGKRKTLDLALGTHAIVPEHFEYTPPLSKGEIAVVRLSCEAKQCMTEHSKTKPRIFDELSSSHEIVHQGDTEAIAAGIVVVNISDEFASPTRQVSGEGELIISRHRQPDVTASMVTHLRGLLIRDAVGEVGFDALCTIVIDCDNTGRPCTLHTDPPAPQPGDRDHYDTFVARIAAAYTTRFSE
jgi:hypothetical protein